MKKLLFLLIAISCFQISNSQVFNVNGVDSFLVLDKDDGLDSNLSPEDKRKIRLKKYLTEGFKPANIGKDKSVFFLRYNIYADQMEFVKEEKVYYLKKEKDTKLTFRTLQKTYQVLELNGDLGYYVLQSESDKMGLVTKEIVRFIEAQKARTNYDEDKPADYRRQKDQHYFVVSGELYKVPKKKKDFYAFFKSNQGAIKKYMKKEKLGYKSAKDLIKIVAFNNSLK